MKLVENNHEQSETIDELVDKLWEAGKNQKMIMAFICFNKPLDEFRRWYYILSEHDRHILVAHLQYMLQEIINVRIEYED